MADIFLSYAHEDLEAARAIAGALESQGWSVFWDRHIPPGRTFADYIGERIKECRVVVVLWSPHSVAKRWVLLEATHGLNRNPPALIPILIAQTPFPFEFTDVHATDLTEWRSGVKGIEFDGLVSEVGLRAPRSTLRPSDSLPPQSITRLETGTAVPSIAGPPEQKSNEAKKGSLTAFMLLKARGAQSDLSATLDSLEGGRQAAQAVLDSDPTHAEAKRLFQELSKRIARLPDSRRKM